MAITKTFHEITYQCDICLREIMTDGGTPNRWREFVLMKKADYQFMKPYQHTLIGTDFMLCGHCQSSSIPEAPSRSNWLKTLMSKVF